MKNMKNDPPIDPRLTEIDDCLYRLAARALVIHDGKVLLVHEKDDDWWSFPGGGIDYGEDLQQALLRELSEELGVATADIKTDFRIAYVAMGVVVNGVPRANLFYNVTVPADRIRTTNDVVEFGWFTPDEIASPKVKPSTNDTAALVAAIKLQIEQQGK